MAMRSDMETAMTRTRPRSKLLGALLCGALLAPVLAVFATAAPAGADGSVAPFQAAPSSIDAAAADELTASFSGAADLDVAKTTAGAALLEGPAAFSASNQPINVLSSSAANWQSPNATVTDQTFVVELGGGGTVLIDRIVATTTTATTSVRNFEVALSDDGVAESDFDTVLTGELGLVATPQSFDVTPRTARYLRFRAIDNHGGTRIHLTELGVGGPTRGGGYVSAPYGPRASLLGASSVQGLGWQPENAIDSSLNSGWMTANFGGPGAWLRVALGGEGTHQIGRVSLLSRLTNTDIRDFEVRVGTDPDPATWTTAYTGTALSLNTSQSFAFAPTSARYVELRVISTYGANRITLNDFGVQTVDGLNVIDTDLGVGAEVVDVSNGATSAGNVLLTEASQWTTSGGLATDQHLTVVLRNGDPHVIDRVMLNAVYAPRARNVEARRSAETSVAALRAACAQRRGPGLADR